MQESFKHPPVGGVDTSGEIDKISIQNAVETPFWLAIWATEPERVVDVRMSYSDLKNHLRLNRKGEKKEMRLVNADDVKEIICKHEKRLVQKQMIYEVEKLKSHNKEAVGLLIENRIKELRNSRAGYMVCGVSCNHAVVAELERLLKDLEK